MKVKKDHQSLVRLENDVFTALLHIRKNCDWPVTMKVLASFAAREGLIKTRQTFNAKPKDTFRVH